jgi:hypothetical protein
MVSWPLPPLELSPRTRWLTWTVLGLLLAVGVATLIRGLTVPSGDEMVRMRQSDTLGMSLSLSLELRAHGLSALWQYLRYPTILQRGLLDGINGCEFPLLNVIIAPAFFLSSAFAAWFGVLFIFTLNLIAGWVFLPRLLRLWGVSIPPYLAVLLWLGTTTAAHQIGVVMPEGLAFPLVVIGATILMEQPRFTLMSGVGILLCNLGLAAKAPSVIALGTVGFWALFTENGRPARGTLLACIAASLLFPGWWYGLHLKHILEVAQGPQLMAPKYILTQGFNPLARFQEIGISGTGFLLARETALGQFPLGTGWIWLVMALMSGEGFVVALYGIALLGAMSLGGSYMLQHQHHFIGTSLFAMILMARTLARVKDNPWRRGILSATLVFGVGLLLVGDLQTSVSTPRRWALGKQAAALIPQDHALITDDSAYPQKMLFIGRPGLGAGPGAVVACAGAEYAGHKIALVLDAKLYDTQGGIRGPCSDWVTRTERIQSESGTWVVALIDRTQH